MTVYGMPIEPIIGIALIAFLFVVLWFIAFRDTSGAQLYSNMMSRHAEAYEAPAGIHYNCPQKSNCHPILESCHFHGKANALP